MLTEDIVRRIAAKHGLPGEPRPMPKLGIVNDIWAIGAECVLRVPTELEYAETLFAESVAAPAARAAGVPTPEILVFDESLDVVDVPYMVTRRVGGLTLGVTPVSPTWESSAYEWRFLLDDLAAQFVVLHQTVKMVDDPHGRLNPWWLDDPWEEVGDSVERGALTLDEARWFERLLSRLTGAFAYDPKGPCDTSVFVHHDLHPWNVMVTPESRLAALLDWGNACFGDPAVDFCGFPLWALPPLLDAYRLAGGFVDDGFEGRALYMWVTLAVREPLFLDPKVFARYWWRLPVDGVEELRYRLDLLPTRWRRWTV